MTNKEIGKYGEELAQNFLTKKGFKILETNFKYSRLAEIDVIALKNDTIHFVEVKTRNSLKYGVPFEAIDAKKMNSIFKCAQYYLKTSNVKYKKFQIDAIGIVLNDKQSYDIKFLENISLF